PLDRRQARLRGEGLVHRHRNVAFPGGQGRPAGRAAGVRPRTPERARAELPFHGRSGIAGALRLRPVEGRMTMRAALTLFVCALLSCSPHRAAETWQAVTVPTDADFRGVWFTDSLNGWITGGGWAVD